MAGIEQAKYEPQPPLVPQSHPMQRYFRGDPHNQDVTNKYGWNAPSLRVFRDGERDDAELSIRLLPFGELGVNLSPAELRNAAFAMLDAALDIETNPAAVLMQAAKEGGAS